MRVVDGVESVRCSPRTKVSEMLHCLGWLNAGNALAKLGDRSRAAATNRGTHRAPRSSRQTIRIGIDSEMSSMDETVRQQSNNTITVSASMRLCKALPA